MNGDLEGIQMLFKLKDPPDVNAIDQNSNTALHHACFHGQTDIITYLLNTHTNIHVEAKNIDGNTPLHKAAVGGHVQAAKILVQYRANVLAQNKVYNIIYNVFFYMVHY